MTLLEDSPMPAHRVTATEMATLIASGRAQPWTSPLPPDNTVPNATKVDGAWYLRRRDAEDYELADGESARTLSECMKILDWVQEVVRRNTPSQPSPASGGAASSR
ncbi:hypothetical protein GCM10022247_34850 [Allokutzneria multivorans]|uniref:Uncharacterized protein n=1 Tax=Allokutzneria multivorans TaxID=1142134 RepID=A0ABP7SCA2_9PSEU